jgi:hypothetical protein
MSNARYNILLGLFILSFVCLFICLFVYFYLFIYLLLLFIENESFHLDSLGMRESMNKMDKWKKMTS